MVVGPALHTASHLLPTALSLHPAPPGSSGAALGVAEAQVNLPVTVQHFGLNEEILYIAVCSWKGSVSGGILIG